MLTSQSTGRDLTERIVDLLQQRLTRAGSPRRDGIKILSNGVVTGDAENAGKRNSIRSSFTVFQGVLSVTYLCAEGCRVAFGMKILFDASEQAIPDGTTNLLTLAKVTDGLLDLFHIQEA